MAYPPYPIGVNDWAFQRELNLTARLRRRLYLPYDLPDTNGLVYNNAYMPLDEDYIDYGYTIVGGYAATYTPAVNGGFTQNARRGMAATVSLLQREFLFGNTLAADFSLSFWFRIEELMATQVLYLYVNGSDPSAKFYTLQIVDSGGWKLQFVVGDGISGVVEYTSTAVLEPNRWHNVVWTDDGGDVQSFMDGVLDSAFTYTRPSALNQGYTNESFANNNGNNISLDEISTWFKSLTQADVDVLYALDNKDTNGRDLGYKDFEATFLCHDTHIFGGGQRSSIEKLNLGREMTKNDRLIVCNMPLFGLRPHDVLIIENSHYEVMAVQNAGGLNHHAQIFCKSIS